MLKLYSWTVFLICCGCAQAGTYWISPAGSDDAAGSASKPFRSIQTALAKVGGGHTFIFRAGYYTGQITLLPKYAGKPFSPTVLKSEYKYKAILNGSPGHCIFVQKGCDWIIIDGFDIGGAQYSGVEEQANYVVVRNCRIHNNALQGIGAHDVTGSVFENNLVEYNGSHPQFDHGIYTSGSKLIIRNNIFRHNSCCGIQAVPAISFSVIENNLVHNNRYGILVHSAGQNKIVNNTVAANDFGIDISDANDDTVANNLMWQNHSVQLRLKGNSNRKKTNIDYNFCNPKCELSGPHNVYANSPLFIDAEKGLYWPKKDSAIIGKGSAELAPEQDFFGRPKRKDKADIGFVPYDPNMNKPEMKRGWYLDWPCFSFYPEHPGYATPDMWALPTLSQTQTGINMNTRVNAEKHK
jgi:parallel beta-helix repeat protein